MRALVFHNTSAGKGDHTGEALTAVLQDAGYDVGYGPAKGRGFADRLREAADLIVIAGGDGTIRKVVARMPDRGVPIGILPLGTSNNVARSLGIAGDVRSLVAGWRAGRTQSFDIGVATGPWGSRSFIEAVGLGALATSNDKASGGKALGKQKLRRGREAFARIMKHAKPLEMTIDIDGNLLSGRWILIEALNIPFTGPALVLGPDAEAGDGVLDILCIGEERRSDMLDWLVAPEGTPPPVTAIRGRSMRLDWNGHPALRIDDKLAEAPEDGEPTPVTVALEDQPLRFLLSPAEEDRDPKGHDGGGRQRGARAKGGAKPMKGKAKRKDGGEEADLAEDRLHAIERVAVEFANLAGAEIASALGGLLAVRYKGAAEAEQVWRDPVSEVDHRVEQLIRTGLADRFPDHGVIGEEINEPDPRRYDFLWVIDPIDGTANFVNGFPLFAASIGVLYQGRPVAGALWCATGHALRSGVYHASLGGVLRFDGDTVAPRQNPEVRRRLAGVPHAAPGKGAWETRKTGSASIECAFVAAGLLEAARFERPNLWDVAGGVMLVQAVGGQVLTRNGDGWTALDRFTAPRSPDLEPDLRNWRQPLMIGRVGQDALIAGLGG